MTGLKVKIPARKPRKDSKEGNSPIMKRDIDIKLKRHIDKLLLESKFNPDLQNPITELSHFHFSQKHINVYFLKTQFKKV